MSGSGREALPDVRLWSGTLPVVLDWCGRHPGCPGVVVTPSRKYESGREALPKCLVVVGRLSQMSGSCREALPDVR